MICAYVAKRYLNLKATDAQINAFFMHCFSKVTSSATVKLQSKWKICILSMKLHLNGWNIRSKMLLTILLGNPYIFAQLFTWSFSRCIRLIAGPVFKLCFAYSFKKANSSPDPLRLPFGTKRNSYIHQKLFTWSIRWNLGGNVVEWFRVLDLKSGGPWFKSSTLLLSGFVLGSPKFNSSTTLCK